MACCKEKTIIVAPHLLPAPTNNSPEFVFVDNVASFTLNSRNANGTIVIDNQVGYSGVLTLYVDPAAKVGSYWDLTVLYGFNGGEQFTQGTSLIVTYGLDGATITAIENIADHQTILQVATPFTNVVLEGGNIQNTPTSFGVEDIGIANRYTFISSVTATDTYSSGPDNNGVAIGKPTLTNYGVVQSTMRVQYLGSRYSAPLNQTAPTFVYTVTNTYFPILNQ